MKAIILSCADTGEANKRLTVITEEFGRLQLHARGIRRPKSRLFAAAQPFSLCELTAFKGRGFYSVTSASLIDGYQGLLCDVERLSYGAYILELVEKTSPEDMPAGGIFNLLKLSLKVLSSTDIPPRLWTSVFVLKYLQLSGYIGEGGVCAMCAADTALYISGGALVCQSCGGRGVPVSSGVIRAVRHALNSPPARLFSFRTSPEVGSELFVVSQKLLLYNIEIELKTLKYAENIGKLS